MKETDRTLGKTLHEMELKSRITNQAETGVEEKQARGTECCGNLLAVQGPYPGTWAGLSGHKLGADTK